MGVRARTAPMAFYIREEKREHFLTGSHTHTDIGQGCDNLLTKQENNLVGRWYICLRC